MKILLVAVNAKYIHSCPAVYSLKAYADQYKKTDCEIEIAEYTINDRYGDILSDIMRKKAQVIAFSVYIWNVDRVLRLIGDIRRIEENRVQIWAGGPESSNSPEKFIVTHRNPEMEQNPESDRNPMENVSMNRGGRVNQMADLCMVGEGEETFTRLADRVTRHTASSAGFKELSFADLKGLAIPENGGIRYTGIAPLTDMSRIPFLYSDLSLFENRIIYYESSRGCPFRCSYCLSSIDKQVRFRDRELVRKELQFFLDNQVRQVKFVDRTFNLSHEHAGEIWRYIREHDNGVTNFHFEIEAALMTDEEIRFLNTFRPGLVQMEIGVQSTNEETLKLVNRRAEIDRIEEVVAALRKPGNINLHLDLIAGLPGEDLATFRQSFNRVYRMRPDQFQLGFLKVLQGTEIERRKEEFGIVASAASPYQVLKTSWMTYDELVLLEQISDMIELFYNSRFFIRSLPLMEELFESPFDLYEKLAEYYVKMEYNIRQPSAIKRYEIMSGFVEWILGSRTSGNEEKNGLAGIYSYLAFDKALHFNKSRHMHYTETFHFPEGDKTFTFDYAKRNPVNGEAAYTE